MEWNGDHLCETIFGYLIIAFGIFRCFHNIAGIFIKTGYKKKICYVLINIILLGLCVLGVCGIIMFVRKKKEMVYQMLIYTVIVLFLTSNATIWGFQRAYWKWYDFKLLSDSVGTLDKQLEEA